MQRLLHITSVQPTLAQFLTNSRGTVASIGPIIDEAFQIAGLTQEPFFSEPIKGRLDQLISSATLAQLAGQLNPTMFAAGE